MQPRMEPRFNPRAAQNNRFGNRQSAPAQARRNFAPSGGSTFAGGILSFSIDGRSNRRTFALFSVITLVLLFFSFFWLMALRTPEIINESRRYWRAEYEKEMKDVFTISVKMGAEGTRSGANLLTNLQSIDEYLKKHKKGPYSRAAEVVSSNRDFYFSDDEMPPTPTSDFVVFFIFLIPVVLLMVYSWIFVLGRRLHDLGFSAQWIFLIWFLLTALFICLVGVFEWVLLPLLLLLLAVGIFSFVPGNVGINEYETMNVFLLDMAAGKWLK